MNTPLHLSRRQWLKRTACGFGALALSDIVRAATNPLAARIPGVQARLLDDDGHLTLLTDRLGEVHAWLADHL